MSKHPRKHSAKSIYILFVVLIFLSSSLFAQQKQDVLKILHLTDVHICNLTGYHPSFVAGREHYGNGIKPLTDFLKTQPKQMGVDAVIITGDLIDYFEAETEKGPWLATQVEQFVPIYNSSPVPVFMTLGNHDIASYWYAGEPEKKNFQLNAHMARAAWIRNISCFQYGTFYSRKFTVGKTTYHFIFLDNGYSLGNGAYIDKPQLDWLNFQVKKAGENPVVIFMHKYFPTPDLDGDGNAFKADSDFALDEEACSKGLLNTLNKAKNVKAMFVGHGHKNISEMLKFPLGHEILQTETAAFAQNPNNWRRIDFYESKVVVYSGIGKKIELEIPLK